MKKLLAAAVTLCMALSLASCGGGGTSTGKNPPSGSGSGSEGGQTYTMVLAHDEILESPLHKGFEAFKEYVETESGGKLQVQLYANGELGDAAPLANMISMNNVQGSGFNSDILSTYNDKLSFLTLPFLFDDYAQAEELVLNPDGALHKLFQEEANKVGFYILGFQYQGQRGFSNSVREINTADDLKGLKVRVKQTDTSVATFDALGCNVTPMSFNEVYTALAQKTVDAQDNPANNTINNKFNEVQSYYSTLGHDMNLSTFAVNYDWLMSLPEELREIVLYAGEEFGAKQVSEGCAEEEVTALEKIDESGCKVTQITDKSSFVEATKPVYEKFRGIYGDEFMDTILKAVGK